MSVLDAVLGCVVVGLAGWALVQSGSARPPGGGCGGGCSSRGCGAAEPEAEDEGLVTLGGRADDEKRGS